MNVIGGEHKVGQAVSHSSDGFIALNRLPESLPAAKSQCEQEDICVLKKGGKMLPSVEKNKTKLEMFVSPPHAPPILLSWLLNTFKVRTESFVLYLSLKASESDLLNSQQVQDN